MERDKNNLDLFRIIAACMVIVGHSYILLPQAGATDIIQRWTHFTYSGALAVKIFFFISGLVVTNSLLQKKDIVDFFISRTFRIFPALIFLLLVSALLIAPFMSSFTFHQYFDSPATYNYIKENFVLKTNYNLPRVFESNPYPGAVNGALWTLPNEVGCYLFICVVFLLGIFPHKKIANFIFLAIIIDSILPQRVLLYFLGDWPELFYLPASFSVGALLALNAERIEVNVKHFLALAILTYLLWNTRYAEILFCLSAFSLVLYISSLESFIKFKPKNDLSYGIYLWGFFVQQCVFCLAISKNVYINMLVSLLISIVLGALSWFLIEKRCIRIGKNIITKINQKNF